MGLNMKTKTKLSPAQLKMKAVLKPIVESMLKESEYYTNSELNIIR
jgi:hypothetical protein